MVASDYFRPIDSNHYVKGIIENRYVLDHIVGVKSDGTTCLVVRELKQLPVRKGSLRKTTVFGDYKAYNVNDLISGAGAFTVLQGTTPWFVSSKAHILNNDNISGATLSNTYDAILKSCVINTSNAVGNRQLLINLTAPCSKTVGPSLTAQDLLDREVAWPANTVLDVNNKGPANNIDTITLTWVGS